MRTDQVDAIVARFVEMNLNEVYHSATWDKVYDLADWFGPIVVAEIPGRGGGRGIVTTRDVAPGELLIGRLSFFLSSSPLSLKADSLLSSPSRESLRRWHC